MPHTSKQSTLFIKNMVCRRCIMAVENILQRNAIEVQSVSLGEVVLSAPISPEMREKLSAELEAVGFELIGDRRSQLIESIKRETIIYARAESGLSHLRLSDFLQERLHLDYHYLSDLFSAVEGQTLEKFFIAHRIERVKELLVYNELPLSDIAVRLGYSSTAYLSTQFKKQTGLTPTRFKQLTSQRRRALDEL